MNPQPVYRISVSDRVYQLEKIDGILLIHGANTVTIDLYLTRGQSLGTPRLAKIHLYHLNILIELDVLLRDSLHYIESLSLKYLLILTF